MAPHKAEKPGYPTRRGRNRAPAPTDARATPAAAHRLTTAEAVAPAARGQDCPPA